MPGKKHSKSNKNPATAAALERKGMSPGKAIKMANGLLKKGVKKGVHRSKRGKRK